MLASERRKRAVSRCRLTPLRAASQSAASSSAVHEVLITRYNALRSMKFLRITAPTLRKCLPSRFLAFRIAIERPAPLRLEEIQSPKPFIRISRHHRLPENSSDSFARLDQHDVVVGIGPVALAAEKGTITADRARTSLSGLYAWSTEGDANLTNPVMGSRRRVAGVYRRS